MNRTGEGQMDIRGLGYIGITAPDVDDWRPYGEMLGAMVSNDDNGLRMRFDERPYRVLIGHGQGGLAFAGWELPDSAALEFAATQLSAAGLIIERGTVDDCEHRQVRGLIRTTDPGGFTLELFHGPILDHELFVSPAGVSGFTTGAHGMGHIVLGTPALEESIDFYTDVLGFRVSDYWRPGDDDIVFLRCNRRHHSLALVPASEPALYHFMVEARTLDDVGRTLDRHLDAGTPISMTLGKHTNDHMVSFYSRSPSGFDVEFGCGGLLVDDATW
ncbi:VOC family protein, partial [Ilumatobacter nonamiensis]|uniref:VOC family protein n=1 Tax=Ilumatobacter nonamiensis TaxID=467093 RepID=UPI00130DFE2B